MVKYSTIFYRYVSIVKHSLVTSLILSRGSWDYEWPRATPDDYRLVWTSIPVAESWTRSDVTKEVMRRKNSGVTKMMAQSLEVYHLVSYHNNGLDVRVSRFSFVLVCLFCSKSYNGINDNRGMDIKQMKWNLFVWKIPTRVLQTNC